MGERILNGNTWKVIVWALGCAVAFGAFQQSVFDLRPRMASAEMDIRVLQRSEAEINAHYQDILRRLDSIDRKLDK